MRLFGRRRDAPPSAPEGLAVFSSGRRLRTDLDLTGCLHMLEALIDEPREGVPRLLPSTFQWLGNSTGPTHVVSLAYDDLTVAAFWPQPGGGTTEFGLFPLESGPNRLMMPIIGQWKMVDPSLSSIGLVEGGQLGLFPPKLDPELLASTLVEAGFPATDDNISLLTDQIGTLVLIKCQEFIRSRDVGYAAVFADLHRHAAPDTMLEALASWNIGIVPYVQDLYYRVCAILLNRDEHGNLTAAIWGR